LPDDICERLANAIRPGEVVIATPRSDRELHWERYPESVIDRIAARVRPGLLVVKSDGTRGRALKAPAEHEPPIPSSATQVIVCAGLDVLGEPFDGDHVHRIEQARQLTSCREGDIVTADLVVELLTHDRGGRRNVPPGARISALLDGPSTAEHERLGSYIAGRLVYAGFHRRCASRGAMKWPFRRRPRITEEIYGNLLTSFGRVVDLDPFISGPSEALADRVVGEHQAQAETIDRATYGGSARYHLKLLASSWMEAAEGRVPMKTAEVFHEALLWKFAPLSGDSRTMVERLSSLARGEVRDADGATPG
jgi:probable selenium-dependent hydroxylase accessory protein YqeC